MVTAAKTIKSGHIEPQSNPETLFPCQVFTQLNLLTLSQFIEPQHPTQDSTISCFSKVMCLRTIVSRENS
jgi:hypothetical protein